MAIHAVTGGAGFIGSHITRALVQRGDQVRVLDNLCTGNLENLADIRDQIEVIEGTVTDTEVVSRALNGVECVFHQAALASVPLSVERPFDSHQAIATGTLTVLDQARKANVRRVIHAASSSCYGNRPEPVMTEELATSPLSPYAAAKLAGEAYCSAFFHTYGLETVNLRYFNVFGPAQDPNSPYSAVIPLFVAAMLSGHAPTVFGDGTQSRDFTYVDNVVHGNLLAAEVEGVGGQTMNLSTGESISLLTLIDSLNRHLGTDFEPQFEPARVGDVKVSVADISRAEQLLGYRPIVDFESGIERTIAYYRDSLGS